jgi:glutamate-1-semialdehyde 2,1-aminomutase
MFCLYFSAKPVHSYADALQSDAALFGRFFHACLARDVYLPPSAYEACFLSTAHEGDMIDRACERMRDAVRSL